jgi:hypothetical protein
VVGARHGGDHRLLSVPEEGIPFLEALQPMYPAMAILVTAAVAGALVAGPHRTRAFFFGYVLVNTRGEIPWMALVVWGVIASVLVGSWQLSS